VEIRNEVTRFEPVSISLLGARLSESSCTHYPYTSALPAIFCFRLSSRCPSLDPVQLKCSKSKLLPVRYFIVDCKHSSKLYQSEHSHGSRHWAAQPPMPTDVMTLPSLSAVFTCTPFPTPNICASDDDRQIPGLQRCTTTLPTCPPKLVRL